MDARPTLSLVLPIYNEEEVIPELHRRLSEFMAALGESFEVVFVDDGSKDDSLRLLTEMCKNEPAYRVVSFARNFGHQAAITAGVDVARGNAVVVMDADLQDPPEVVREMVERWREGFDVVYARRVKRIGETWFKLVTAKLFYRLFAAMIPIEVPLDTGDFRLMSRRVVLVLRSLRETHRFVRGLVAWVGFKQTAVLYERPERFAGETKYPLRKMVRFAIDGITSFSTLPLRFATYLGMFMSVFSVGVLVWALLAHFAFNTTVPGWTGIVVFVSLFASAQLLVTGILGEYVGRIYEEVKRRPLYVVGKKINVGMDDDVVDDDPHAEARARAPASPAVTFPEPQKQLATLVGVPVVGVESPDGAKGAGREGGGTDG